MKCLYLLILFFVIPMLHSCAVPKKTLIRNDPLIGSIIQAGTGREINFESLVATLGKYDVIYLSEKHDNPEHHAIQEKVIRGLIDNGYTPSIGFEFFAMDNTPDLLNFVDSGAVAHSKKTLHYIEADLRKKLGWDTQTDKMWQYYFNLLNIARDQHLTVAGIDLPATLKKRITRKGIEHITPIEKEQIFSTHLSDRAYKDYMFSIFKAVHCGMGHEKMQSKLYDTWVARNDKMALSITRLHRNAPGPLVIIIGNGHTEYGLGVMDRVSAIDSTITQVNLSLQEINVSSSPLSDYLVPLELAGFDTVPPADFLWFTQRVSYTDPCVAFKESLKKMRIGPVKE